MSQLFTKEWWIAAGTRAIKTVAEVAIATIGSALVLQQVDWELVLSSSLLAGILSLLFSLKGLPEVKLQQKIEQMEEKERSE